MELVILMLLILLIFALWKWWSYWCFSIGLIYFAALEHDWSIDAKETKKILEYSMIRNVKDFLKIK